MGVSTIVRGALEAGKERVKLNKVQKRMGDKYVAPPQTLGLISKAEELALNLPQAKQSGFDLGRYLRKNGVTQSEIKALNLAPLFKQERVTQEQLLEHIDKNRIELEKTVYEGEPTDVEEDYVVEQLTPEEAYGDSYLEEEASEIIQYSGLMDDYEWSTVANALDLHPHSQKTYFLEDQFNRYKGDDYPFEFEDLDNDLKDFFIEEAREIAQERYDQSPVERIKLQIDGVNTNYQLVGNEDIGYYPPANERTPINISDSVYSRNEAQIVMRDAAYANNEFSYGSETGQYSEYTTEPDNLLNYRESLIQLPSGNSSYRGGHYSEDNLLSHYRTSDKTDEFGNKILYVEEIQSDQASDMRKRGVKDQGLLDDGIQAAEDIKNDLSGITAGFYNEDRKHRPSGTTYDQMMKNSLEMLGSKNEGSFNGARRLQTAMHYFRQNAFQQTKNRISQDVFSFDMTESDLKKLIPSDEINKLANKRNSRFDSGLTKVQAAISEIEDNNRYNGIDDKINELNKLSPSAAKVWREQHDKQIEGQEQFLISEGILQEGQLNTVISSMNKNEKRLEQVELQERALDPSPFVDKTEDWNLLTAKQILLEADEGGYDKVAFAPYEAQLDRWNDTRLEQQYKTNIPSAFKKAGGVDPEYIDYEPASAADAFEGRNPLVVGGFNTPSIDMRQRDADGLTVGDKVRKNNTLFTPAGVGLGASYLGLQAMPKTPEQQNGLQRFRDGVIGGADFMANMGSALTAPFVQGVQHFNAMGSPTAEGRTPSLEALQAQKAELGQMLNYSPRTELGQQYSDGLKNMIGEGLRSVAPALQETHEGLYERENMNPYRTASDGLGALHEWYKSLDPKSRMHVDAGMDVSPY